MNCCVSEKNLSRRLGCNHPRLTIGSSWTGRHIKELPVTDKPHSSTKVYLSSSMSGLKSHPLLIWTMGPMHYICFEFALFAAILYFFGSGGGHLTYWCPTLDFSLPLYGQVFLLPLKVFNNTFPVRTGKLPLQKMRMFLSILFISLYLFCILLDKEAEGENWSQEQQRKRCTDLLAYLLLSSGPLLYPCLLSQLTFPASWSATSWHLLGSCSHAFLFSLTTSRWCHVSLHPTEMQQSVATECAQSSIGCQRHPSLLQQWCLTSQNPGIPSGLLTSTSRAWMLRAVLTIEGSSLTSELQK